MLHPRRLDSAEILRGLDLVYKQFLDTLARFGLKTIEARGSPFDPNFHQAVSTVATDQFPKIPLSKKCVEATR
jgi:molecular chaperone GrpE